MAASEASRVTALKEAAWYRAKLAAYERGNTSEAARLEHERTTALENQLSKVLRDKAQLDHQLASLSEQVKLETLLRTSADERLAQTSKRAMAAEEAQMCVHEDISALQKQAYAAESALREQSERAVTLNALLEREKADHEQTRAARDDAHKSVSTHGDSLVQLRAALAATGARADEHHQLYTQQREMAQKHQQTTNALQAELNQKNLEVSEAEQRIEELQSLLSSAEAEAAAHRLASSNGLTQVTQVRDLTAQRSADATLPPEVEDKIRSLEDEVSSLQETCSASRRAVDEAGTELVQVRERNMSLEKQQAGLQSELDIVRAQLAIALQELARLKDKLTAKSLQLHDTARTTEGTNIKLQLLRDYMQERGIAPPVEDEGTPANGIQAQLVALQQEADEGSRLASELQTKLADSQVEIDGLKRELSRGADQVSLDAAVRRADASERELAETTRTYKERMAQLENDYYAAVSFVKGCEKMLRTMRSELSRTKQENHQLIEEMEQLKTSTSGATSHTSSGEKDDDLAALQGRLASITSVNEEVTTQNRDLERRMASLISEQKEAYDRSRTQLDAATEAGRRVQTLEDQIGSLEDALTSTRQELQSTLSLNQHLTRELARTSHLASGSGRTFSPVALDGAR